ncbi:MAG TPA: STAS domain-containing protein [Actinophytocola sp.]|uniref:STAS domain-containing protein n=1 Tax=Actinophytocola sp. TaxID=1872138 RepID=UPI002DBC3B89|nr:STAS domain-containing protein [Actinophytocola sp.]HEU5470708.1 STAS domain-containing protein [Actinophytocola sp.]
MVTAHGSLLIEAEQFDEVAVLTVSGTLDLASYAVLRDTLIRYLIESTRAVVADIGALRIPTPATLSVFPTVRLRMADWPGLPVLLVEPDPVRRGRLSRLGVSHAVPVFTTVAEALGVLDEPSPHRRAVIVLPNGARSCVAARGFIHRTLRRWGDGDALDQDATAIANALVANAVRHGNGMPSLRLDLSPDRLALAVADDGPEFMSPGTAGRDVPIGLGLMLVEALSVVWGSCPAPTGGKIVWAVLPYRR